MTQRRKITAAGLLGVLALLALVTTLWVMQRPAASFGQGVSASEQRAQQQARAAAAAARRLQERARIGLGVLARRLGPDMPIGRGVKFAHVEGLPGKYLPDLGSRRYDRIDARAMSGPSEAFGHTIGTAAIIYGPQGMAPGVSEIDFYAMPDWLGRGFLRAGTPFPPQTTDARVMTHSWIGNGSPLADEILARVDYVVDVNDVIMVVGVNNGRDTPIPPMLASAYNVIAVGAWNGDSSTGPAFFGTPGRSKPDIVAPGGRTSFATPMAAAAAAMLLEAADRQAQTNPQACRAQTIKALLLTGAQKPEDWSCTPDRPLDPRFGAGRLRVDQSHAIFEAGRAQPRKPGDENAQGPQYAAGPPSGWDVQAVDLGRTLVYDLQVIEDGTPLTATVVWNRRVAGNLSREAGSGKPRWNDFARVADFDLRLERLDGEGRWTLVAQSISRVDNVEHVYAPAAASGRYRLLVPRLDRHAGPWEVAVAWQSGAIPPTTTRIEAEQRESADDADTDPVDAAGDELGDSEDAEP